jgi:hypothetical protein
VLALGYAAYTPEEEIGLLKRGLDALAICQRFPAFKDKDWPLTTPDTTIVAWACQEATTRVAAWAAPLMETFATIPYLNAEELEEGRIPAIYVSSPLTSFIMLDLHVLAQARTNGSPLYRMLLCVYKLAMDIGVWEEPDMFELHLDMVESGCEGETCEQGQEEEGGPCYCEEHLLFLQNEERAYDHMLGIVKTVEIEEGEIERWLTTFIPATPGESYFLNWLQGAYPLVTAGYSFDELLASSEDLNTYFPDRTMPWEAVRFIWNEHVWNTEMGPYFDERYGNGSVDPGFLLQAGDTVDTEAILHTGAWWAEAEEALVYFTELQYKLI